MPRSRGEHSSLAPPLPLDPEALPRPPPPTAPLQQTTQAIARSSLISSLSHAPAKLNLISPQIQSAPRLERTLNLRGAVTLNLLNMIGVGPFITLPLLIGAMGGPQAMLGWILGALLALCDGLVWAELGAALPEAGGTYAYLRTIYPGRLGQTLSFLFLFQVFFSCPLSVASGAIGLSQYATYLAPSLTRHTVLHSLQVGPYTAAVSIGPTTAVAVAALVLAVVLLYRNLARIGVLSLAMLGIVLAAIAWILVTALLHGHLAQAVTLPPAALHLTPAFFAGLASAMLLATYDYWGYYNVSLLGAEIRDPGRTIPRAILLSIGIVALLYIAMNISILAVLPWQGLLSEQALPARRAMVSVFMERAYAPTLGAAGAHLLAQLAAVLIMITAFGSVFALLLGYSRIPYAAAADGNFFPVFARLHPTRGFPYVSLLTLAAAAAVFCFFSLADVIAAMVVIRLLLQFLTQHIGVLYLRRTQPNLARPFRLWLYPLPPLLALLGFTYILLARPNFSRELALAAAVILIGLLLFAFRSIKSGASTHSSAT